MDKIAIVDFGGQYTHLVANRIRRLGVYSEIILPDGEASEFKQYKGVILSGGPGSVLDPESPSVDPKLFEMGIPVLGLCYGHQLMAKILGGSVSASTKREYGLAQLIPVNEESLFKGIDGHQQIWMSHGNAVDRPGDGFSVMATTNDCEYAAVCDEERHFYGLQFHPEVTDTVRGMDMLSNFIDICKCKREWNAKAFLKEIAEETKKACGDKKVFLLVSGGVDSTVAFALLNKVLGPDKVLGLHVDNGLMRYNESEDILEYMKENGFNNLEIYRGEKDFLDALQGKYEPEDKRAIIGKKFIEVKEIAEKDIGLNADEWLLAQGTIYPDTIESAGTKHSDKIKTHHNRVDIILELIEKGLIIEPLAQLYKDEVRMLGEELGIPHDLVWRHPFPGPGLGVRVLCSDGSDAPASDEAKQELNKIASNAGYKSYALPVKSVGVQGDSRTYAHPALVTGKKDWDTLELLSTEITNNVREINRVVYGIKVSDNPEYKLEEAYTTKDRLDKLRAIDHIVTQALHDSGEYDKVWQMPVVLLPLLNANGDECVVLRPISSTEAMTARFCPLSDATLQKIVDEAEKIDGIGDIFFDITNKPPGTIEWE